MIQVNTVRRLLAAADVARDPYAVAEAAASLASANAQDSLARLHYVRALVALGLGVAAKSVAASIPAEHFPDPLRQQLLAAPAGHTAWASRARRFRANAAALVARYPEYAPLLDTWEQASARYELHLASDANTFIRDTTITPLWKSWLRSLSDHRAGNDAWKFDKMQNPTPSPMAFDGIGYGWLLPEVLATTANTYLSYSCAIYIVEPDPVALCMAMHVHDLQSIFAADRVRIFLGPDAIDRFKASFDTHRHWSAPAYVIVSPLTRPALGLEPICESILTARGKKRAVIKEQVQQYYADKDAAYWARRFAEAAAGGPPLRVLGLTTRYSTVLQYSMEEMRRAVASLGQFDMRVAIEPDDHSAESPFLQMLADFRPDLVFQISRMRYENSDIPRNVPFLCWDQDSLTCMRTEAATASLDALTYVAGHGAVHGYVDLGWPRSNCIFVHPAGAEFRYGTDPIDDALLRRHACDISYVSNASEPPEHLAKRLGQRWSTEAAAVFFSEISDIVATESRRGRTWEYVALRNLVRRLNAEKRVGLTPQAIHELAMDMNTLADRCYRHATLEWVSRWCKSNGKTLRLYGRGWDSHPDFAQWAAGMAEPGEQTRAIYAASRINLQIIESGFIHSRSLDGLSAGGFFLAREALGDGLNSPAIMAVYELARWSAKNRITSDEQLSAATDPLIRSRLEAAKAYYDEHEVTEAICPSLQVWSRTPPAAHVFPQLAQITFHDEKSFAVLASRYLADDALRTRLAAEMRAIVKSQMSYTARWKDFHAAVRNGLAAGALAPAGV